MRGFFIAASRKYCAPLDFFFPRIRFAYMQNRAVGDFGVIDTITFLDENSVPIDISVATTKQIIYTKPDGVTTITKTAAFVTDGTDGQISFTTVTGMFDVAGDWTAYGQVSGGGIEYTTVKEVFNVYTPGT